MQVCELNEADPDFLERLIKGVSFLRLLFKRNPEQYDALLSCSKLVEVAPGKIIVRAGETAKCLYALLSGRAVVFRDEVVAGEEINCINTGEMFGDLALLGDRQRRATVTSDPKGGNIMLLAINVKPFCQLDDFSVLNLETKLVFYRAMLHGLYWKLEMNRMLHPDHQLVEDVQKLPKEAGKKDSYTELKCLYAHANKLADLLVQWNHLEEAGGGVLVAR